MAQSPVCWLAFVSEDGSTYYIDWRAFKQRYGGLDITKQGDILSEIEHCHQEQSLTDGPIVKTEPPACFLEATDGR
jgi:hypothetical protein